jgi:hypothetical protein
MPVPPAATTVAVPLQDPKQFTFTWDAIAVMTGGCVMLNDCVKVQPIGELMVHVYMPAQSPVAVAAVPPDGVQA